MVTNHLFYELTLLLECQPFILGLAFYDELNRPLFRNEAEDVCQFVTKMAKVVMPGVTSCLVGGFRRQVAYPIFLFDFSILFIFLKSFWRSRGGN